MEERKKISVVDYDPNWPLAFQQIKNVLIKYLEEVILGIEHVGSTSVSGLKAKPILDIDIIIENDDQLEAIAIERLGVLGYQHVGNKGITGREAFKRIDTKSPNDGSNIEHHNHHLYLCRQDSIALLNHLHFRNYLRAHPDKVIEYGKLKQALAERYPYHIDAYIDGKTNFITDILRETGMKGRDVSMIDRENRLK